jgi:hypothetical protein
MFSQDAADQQFLDEVARRYPNSPVRGKLEEAIKNIRNCIKILLLKPKRHLMNLGKNTPKANTVGLLTFMMLSQI